MAASFYSSPLIGATTTLACFAHEIPHEIADYSILIRSGFTKRQAMQSQFLTAVGAFVSPYRLHVFCEWILILWYLGRSGKRLNDCCLNISFIYSTFVDERTFMGISIHNLSSSGDHKDVSDLAAALRGTASGILGTTVQMADLVCPSAPPDHVPTNVFPGDTICCRRIFIYWRGSCTANVSVTVWAWRLGHDILIYSTASWRRAKAVNRLLERWEFASCMATQFPDKIQFGAMAFGVCCMFLVASVPARKRCLKTANPSF
jgi:hypothetical protein